MIQMIILRIRLLQNKNNTTKNINYPRVFRPEENKTTKNKKIQLKLALRGLACCLLP